MQKSKMAPRETKVTPKVQRGVVKNTTKKSTSTTTIIIKKTMSTTTNKSPIRGNNPKSNARQQANPAPPATPKPKESKVPPVPGSATKSAQKSWKRRPKPAHSGVPVPEKMKKLLQQRLLDADNIF